MRKWLQNECGMVAEWRRMNGRSHNCTAIRARPRRRVGLGRAQLEALEELGELETRGETGATHLRVMDECMRDESEREKE